MLSVVVSLLLAAPLQAKEDLVTLCQKLSQAENYTFDVSTQGEGRGPESTEFKGQYVKGLPVHLARGDMEAYRMNGHVVSRTGEKGWKMLGGGEDEHAGPGHEMKHEKKGDGDEGEENGEKGENGEQHRGRERGGRAAMSNPLETLQLPHEILQGFGDHVAQVNKEEKGGKMVFTGDLNEAGVESLMGRRPPNREGSEPTSSGQFKVTAKDGTIESFVLELHFMMKRGDQETDRSRRVEYQISDISKTKIEVPDEVKSMLK